MNRERESLLSAYLDDQLPPDERRSVEAAVASDPAAAEALRSLAGVRDLVAGLSRPAGPDLAPNIMNRLQRRDRQGWRRRPSIQSLRLAAMAGGVAASLAGLALLGDRLPPPRHPIPPTAPAVPEPILADSAPTPTPTPDVSSEPAVADLVGPPAPTRTEISDGEPAPEIASTGQPGADALAPDLDRSLIRELLGDHAPSPIFLVTNLDGEGTSDRVGALLGLSTHRDFHRIDLPPAEANANANANSGAEKAAAEAVVFAATLNPDEFATFRARLATAFPERFEESGQKPALAAEFAEKGRISTLSANPAADVRIPQTNLAIRFQSRDGRNWPATPQGDDRVSKKKSNKPGAAPGAEAEPAGSNQPRSILVWIIKPPAD